MGISQRKQRQREELRGQVLDAAEEIIATEGVSNVTMRRIASMVEYAPTVLYRLFASKEDLMDHLIARGYGGVRFGYETVLARGHTDPVQTLSGILEAYTDYALAHPNHYRMWFETSELRLEDGGLKMSHGRLEFIVFQPWIDAIESCREAGLFAGLDNLDVFQVLWARVHGLISLRLKNPEFPWLPLGTHLARVLDLAGLASPAR
jgi:AcrR family transcriptional regulator